MNEINETVATKSVNAAGSGKVKTVLFCIWVMAACLLIQAVVSLVGIIPKSVQLVNQYGANTKEYTEAYNEFVTTTPIVMYLQFAASIITFVVAGIWYYFGYVKKEKAVPGNRSLKETFKGWPDAVFILTGAIAAWGLAGTLSSICTLLMPKTAENVNSALNMALGDGAQIIGLISAIILAPITEELIMRGIIFRRSKRAFGIVGCILISTILFSVMHLNVIQGIYVIPMGLFWGYVAYRYNSVIPCICCHMINNFIGMLVPIKFPPIILFIVLGGVAVFVGVRFGIIGKENSLETDQEGDTANV